MRSLCSSSSSRARRAASPSHPGGGNSSSCTGSCSTPCCNPGERWSSGEHVATALQQCFTGLHTAAVGNGLQLLAMDLERRAVALQLRELTARTSAVYDTQLSPQKPSSSNQQPGVSPPSAAEPASICCCWVEAEDPSSAAKGPAAVSSSQQQPATTPPPPAASSYAITSGWACVQAYLPSGLH